MKQQIFFIALFVAAISYLSFPQSRTEMEIDSLLVNAKKGIYWGLMNIPVKKVKIEKSLIMNDKLIARVKVIKELNGIKIESTGYNNTNEMTITLFRSADSLIKEGYIKRGDLENYSSEE